MPRQPGEHKNSGLKRSIVVPFKDKKVSGATAQPELDLSDSLHRLCCDLRLRIPELSHIHPDRVLFSISRSRRRGTRGVYARISPMRFASGEPEMTRRQGRYREIFRMPSLIHNGREIFYVITVLVPRFLRLSFEEKLETVVHELYHISEAFDGDIRRFSGRNYAHGRSLDRYNAKVRELMNQYLADAPDSSVLSFLHLGEREWRRNSFCITGLRVPVLRAKLVARERV